MTLSEFLLARIAEDEAIADQWPDDPGPPPEGIAFWMDMHGHLIYQPRARVFAECDAKRRIVGLHRLYDGRAYRETPCCARCTAGGEYPADDAYTDEQNWPCPTLRALALPYADHPDYDPSWRP